MDIAPVYHRWAQAQRSWQCSWMLIYGFCLLFVYTAINCAYQQQFSDAFLSLCNNILYTIMFVLNALSPVGLKVMGIQFCFTALSHHAKISLDNIWIVDGGIPKFLAIVYWEPELLRDCMLVNITSSWDVNDNFSFIPNHVYLWKLLSQLFLIILQASNSEWMYSYKMQYNIIYIIYNIICQIEESLCCLCIVVNWI